MYHANIVTGTLPKLHALKEGPLAVRNEIKTEPDQMVKKIILNKFRDQLTGLTVWLLL